MRPATVASIAISITICIALLATSSSESLDDNCVDKDGIATCTASATYLLPKNTDVVEYDDTPTAPSHRRYNNQCGLYLAPSTLPHAGLGLFSGMDIPHNHSVNEYIGFDDDNDVPLWTDLFIPIADEYKALPFRGQQRFPSWLQYIWPKHHNALAHLENSFPDVPHVLWDFDLGLNFADGVEFYTYNGDQKEGINAFSPGLASLANSHVWFSNIKRKEYDTLYDNDYNLTLQRHPGVGALTLPDQILEFSVSNRAGIQAGMELVSFNCFLCPLSICKHVAQLLTIEVYIVISSFLTTDEHGMRGIMKSLIGSQRKITL